LPDHPYSAEARKSMVSQEIPVLTLSERLKNSRGRTMNVTEDMKKIAEELVSSYQSKISTIGIIINDTYKLLEDFKTRRNEMSNQLRETLAKEESLRKRDFDNMMENVLTHQEEREKEVKCLLKTFFEEQREIAELIKKSLTGDEKIRINDFKKMLQDIQVKQKARENEVSTALRQFQAEYKEMAESLRSLLNKGEAMRIKDFKEMVKNVRAGQIKETDEAGVKLDEFSEARRDMASERDKTTSISAEKMVNGLKGGEFKEEEEVAKI